MHRYAFITTLRSDRTFHTVSLHETALDAINAVMRNALSNYSFSDEGEATLASLSVADTYELFQVLRHAAVELNYEIERINPDGSTSFIANLGRELGIEDE